MRSGILFVVLVVSRTWIHVRITNTKVTAHICADPVGNLRLIQRAGISLVSAWSGNIDTSGLHWGLDSESELRNLS